MINIPFNFQPESVAVKTASYTIPAGKFAYVTAYVEDGGAFTIDGASAIQSDAKTSHSVVSVSQNLPYTVPTGYYFEGQLYLNDTSVVGVAGSTVITGSAGDKVAISAGPEAISMISGNAATLTGYSRRDSISETNATASFWLPTGTALNGSGTWKATVSIYNEIS